MMKHAKAFLVFLGCFLICNDNDLCYLVVLWLFLSNQECRTHTLESGLHGQFFRLWIEIPYTMLPEP